ncbi:MAG: TRAP transporter substrate-binding protein [Sedimentibacter sp.]|uniref:TRAP transporter substrate-binding protein n=1 Tax=Sedimentibacter sp. TaxID=1960295 RepID=UPI0031596BE0
MRKFRLLSLCLALIMAVGSLAGCASSQSSAPAPSGTSEQKPEAKKETMVFKLANGSAIGDERDQSLQEFARLVDEKSGGTMKVEVFSGGSLGTWRDTIEGLEPGIVQIVCESIGTLEAYSPTASIDAYPYLYRDYDHYKKVMESEIGEQLLATVGQEGGFVIMGPSYRGARVVTSNKKFESADQLKGLKIRAPGIQMYIKTWEYFGASPVPMDPSEIYTGLQQGTVDAQENPVMYNYGSAFYDVCDYLIMTNHVMSTDVFIFNDDYFNGLPEDVQKVFKEAAKEAGNFRTQLVLDKEAATVKLMEEKGMEVIYPDVASFQAKLADFSKEFPNLTELVDKIHAVK